MAPPVAAVETAVVPTSCTPAAPCATTVHGIANPSEAAGAAPSTSTAIAGAGLMATRGLPVAGDGSTRAGAVTFSVSVAMRTGAEEAEKVAPEIHVHCTETAKEAPKAPYAPRLGKLAAADSAVVEAASVPTSCAPLAEAAQATAKPSEATGAPSSRTAKAGGGDMATSDEPVEVLGSTAAGVAVKLIVSVDSRICGESAVSTAPETHVQLTASWKVAPMVP